MIPSRRAWLVLALAGLLVLSGCAGLFGPSPEETTTTTQSEPATTTQGSTTRTATTVSTTSTTSTSTTTTTSTSTVQVGPDLHASIVGNVEDEVWDGETEIVVQVNNAGGASGESNATLLVNRVDGSMYDRTYRVKQVVGPNETRNQTVSVDFDATGAYEVILNGSIYTTLQVQSLDVGVTLETQTQGQTDTEPRLNSSVEGESQAG